jgi:hypothetical protein
MIERDEREADQRERKDRGRNPSSLGAHPTRKPCCERRSLFAPATLPALAETRRANGKIRGHVTGRCDTKNISLKRDRGVALRRARAGVCVALLAPQSAPRRPIISADARSHLDGCWRRRWTAAISGCEGDSRGASRNWAVARPEAFVRTDASCVVRDHDSCACCFGGCAPPGWWLWVAPSGATRDRRGRCACGSASVAQDRTWGTNVPIWSHVLAHHRAHSCGL